MKEWYSNGQRRKEVYTLNDIPFGFRREWYETGQLKEEIHYVNQSDIYSPSFLSNINKYHSCKQWHSNGNLVYESIHDHTQRISTEKHYYPHGELYHESSSPTQCDGDETENKKQKV